MRLIGTAVVGVWVTVRDGAQHETERVAHGQHRVLGIVDGELLLVAERVRQLELRQVDLRHLHRLVGGGLRLRFVRASDAFEPLPPNLS